MRLWNKPVAPSCYSCCLLNFCTQPFTVWLSTSQQDQRAAEDDDGDDLRAYILGTPWQLRCHVIKATVAVLQAAAVHSHADAAAPASEAVQAHRKALLLARERVLAAAADPSERVRLAGANALPTLFSCVLMMRVLLTCCTWTAQRQSWPCRALCCAARTASAMCSHSMVLGLDILARASPCSGVLTCHAVAI